MFDALSDRLRGVLDALRGEPKITEEVLDKTLREVRMALLEADVNVGVVKALLDGVRAKALGGDVLKSLTPGQQIVGIVRDELQALLGEGEAARIKFASQPPTIIFLVGLQGSGKTTTAAKLGLWLKKAGRFPYLVPVDVYRPAAIEQLQRVGGAAGLKVHASDASATPLAIARVALDEARRSGFDTVLVDTAGRLHVDASLMEELSGLKAALTPHEVLFVADAMTGQDAIKSAGEFNRRIGLTGVVLSKMDGDARGGAALSVISVVGVPIAFVGSGERLENLEPFHPDRVVSRILGMGDVLTLIEKAEQVVDREDAARLEEKLRKNEFSLGDFRDQLRTIRKMGPLESIIGMLPGMGQLKGAMGAVDEKEMDRVEAIINAMTPDERDDHTMMNGSRRKRIARGSGTSVEDVNRLLKQFIQMKKMLKVVGGLGDGGGGKASMRKKMGALKQMMQQGGR
jgi:signal recognition particle subunit SRP54